MHSTGRLTLNYKDFNVSDGVNFFRPLSFSLIKKLLRRKNRADTVCGEWVVLGRWVVWFKKGAKNE